MRLLFRARKSQSRESVPAGSGRMSAWVKGGIALVALAMLVAVTVVPSFAGHQAVSQSNTASSVQAAVSVTTTPAGTTTPTAVTACPNNQCPFQLPPGSNPNINNIYYGYTPANSGDKPVLLFVHGLGGVAQDWWSETAYSGVNDMYEMAYDAGYRTAFVSLNPDDQRGPSSNMWVDGQVLAQQIPAVAQHYGVSKLDIITHSKGGVDVQTAIAYDGMAPYVDQVLMLSSPNWGSPLASIICSTQGQPIGGSSGPASAMCSMTPGYMKLFRQMTDPLPSSVKWWVAGGTDHGPQGSILSLTGQLLFKVGGANDGFVTVNSATDLELSRWLFVRELNHDSIRVGHNSFPFIQAELQSTTTPSLVPPLSNPDSPSVASTAVPTPRFGVSNSGVLQSGAIVRGGTLNGNTSVAIPVESGAQVAYFALLTSGGSVNASLADPSGHGQSFSTPSAVADPMLEGMTYRAYEATNPASGKWHVSLSGANGATYLLLVGVQSPLNVTVSGVPNTSLQPGQTITPQASVQSPSGSATIDTVTTQVLQFNNSSGKPMTVSAPTSGAVQIENQPDVVSLTITVTGHQSDGSPFERTFIRSLPVLPANTAST